MDSDDAQQPVVSEPAGRQLRRAREQKGLSVSAVADAQHLRPAVIHAIEDGDYEQIDSELFLKGYVRTYAKQVGLDADAVIATLDEELEPLRQQKAQAEELNPLVDIERRRRQKRRVAKLLFFILIIAFVAFIGLRFLDTMDTSTTDEDAGSADPASDMSEPAEPEPESGQQQPEPDSQSSAGSSDTEEQPEVAAGQSEAGAAEDDLAEDDSSNAGVSEAEPSADLEEIPLVTASESGEADRSTPETDSSSSDDPDPSRIPVVTSNTEPALEESAQTGETASSARLEMSFSDECWVQVTDSSGNRLVGSLQREGDRIDVSGRVPVQVIVGAVDAIESIRFDGEPVNMSGFRVVNNRAEFTLDI
ncbi:RodZ domain-containing protein [Marinobacter sp. HL-58]|uniref:RodZ domain-containing protein n=1 Tax=Marinobacter sp. HL-58 TaxID=1479237 RepID=UPI00048575CC|nr:RodZ domain-containing protein [Marinobacter sp. HL-58]KPP97720.1 MAG: cytoskeleton protein RodZ [Marinobacter sp. HL-58]